jgi:TetR/AcrR family transcriptional regulator, regulator of cefoperazone and chloramphenicol sensitivity
VLRPLVARSHPQPVPRDSTATKERLLREAERLFARRGLYRVTLREITDAAGQRNVSAINYHFGSREGLLAAILARHGVPTDRARGALRARLADDPSSRDLIAVLVIPYVAHLRTPDGRDYLRIVAHLSGSFTDWRAENEGTGPHLVEVLTTLEQRPPEVTPEVRRERVVELIMLMTAATSHRARLMESGRPAELDDEQFAANLTDVLVGVLEAPLHGPLPLTLTEALADTDVVATA